MRKPTRRIHIVCDDPRHAPRTIRLATYNLVREDDGLWYPYEMPRGRGLHQETADDAGKPHILRELVTRFRPGEIPGFSKTGGYSRTVFSCPVCRRSFSARTAETLAPVLDRLADEIDTPVARTLSLADLRSSVHE